MEVGMIGVLKSLGQWVVIAYIMYLVVREVTMTVRHKRKEAPDIMGLRINGNIKETVERIVNGLKHVTREVENLKKQHELVARDHEEQKACLIKMQGTIDTQTDQLVEKHNQQIANQREMVTYLKIMAKVD